MRILEIERNVLETLEHRELIRRDTGLNQGDHKLVVRYRVADLLMNVWGSCRVVREENHEGVAPVDRPLDLPCQLSSRPDVMLCQVRTYSQLIRLGREPLAPLQVSTAMAEEDCVGHRGLQIVPGF